MSKIMRENIDRPSMNGGLTVPRLVPVSVHTHMDALAHAGIRSSTSHSHVHMQVSEVQLPTHLAGQQIVLRLNH